MQRLRNERGVTLAELLATIVVASIVIIFVTSILVLVNKQFKSQTASSQQLTDVTLAVKVITKDMRKYGGPSIDESKLSFTDGPTYELIGNILKVKKDEEEYTNYIYEVKTFEVTHGANNSIDLFIESESGEKIITTITVR